MSELGYKLSKQEQYKWIHGDKRHWLIKLLFKKGEA